MNRKNTQDGNDTFALKLIQNLKIWLVVKPLQAICSSRKLETRLAAMRTMPKHTVGNDLAKLLDKQKLSLIPGFFEHDLNHLILGYGMESSQELCMQAYLIGNRYYKWQCFIFLASAIVVPRLWPSLWKHFQLGRSRPSVGTIQFEECLQQSTADVKRHFNSPLSAEPQLEFAS